jgi:hypothetical protein
MLGPRVYCEVGPGCDDVEKHSGRLAGAQREMRCCGPAAKTGWRNERLASSPAGSRATVTEAVSSIAVPHSDGSPRAKGSMSVVKGSIMAQVLRRMLRPTMLTTRGPHTPGPG